MFNNLIIIFLGQEYNSCNHKFLYNEFANNKLFSNVLIVEIPADIVYSPIFKYKRIIEHFTGCRKLSTNIYIYRPLIFIRELISTHYINKINGCLLKHSLSKFQIIKNADNIFCLFYGPQMYEIAKESVNKPYMLYYVVDEHKYIARNCKINKLLYKYEKEIMPHCNIIFTASDKLTERRRKYNKNVFTIGNGTSLKNINRNIENISKYKWSKYNSIGMFGHIRNWIDFGLLEQLVNKMSDSKFIFAGPIQEKIKNYFLDFISKNKNCIYIGVIAKEKMSEIYQSVSIGIVPYKKNKFIEASKPIKIAEFILNGIPVVTVPCYGYKEYSFLKFAKTVDEFKKSIESLFGITINPRSREFLHFITYNAWENISKKMIKKIKDIDGVKIL